MTKVTHRMLPITAAPAGGSVTFCREVEVRTISNWLVMGCALMLAGSYAWTHRYQVAIPAGPAAAQESEERPDSIEEEARKMVTVTGPLVEYMKRQKTAKSEKTQTPSYQLSAVNSATNHVGDSPVGTRMLLRKTFGVATAVSLPFELPPHAANPQLRGVYRAFVPTPADDDTDADVEFLVLNNQQYEDFLNERPSDALFSADGAPEQEINFSLPPTRDQPVKYYLVFRNSFRSSGKKIVRAEFRIDF